MGVAVLIVALLPISTAPSARRTPACATTPPNGWTPSGAPADAGNHGSGKLMVALWPLDLTATDTRYVRPDGTVYLKYGWWRSVEAPVSITGRRLDDPAPPLVATTFTRGYPPTGFMPSGLLLPTRGCWEVTGTVAGDTVTFVVDVAVGRERRPPPIASLRAASVHGRTARLTWHARRNDLSVEVALRHSAGPWRVSRTGLPASGTVRLTLSQPAVYAVRVRGRDDFGPGQWSSARRFRIRANT